VATFDREVGGHSPFLLVKVATPASPAASGRNEKKDGGVQMAKYASWADFERNVPTAYRENATPEAYRAGLTTIAPPGTTPRADRVNNYGTAVEGKAERVVSGYRRAMFS
jgi:hypothetical protein